MAPENFQINITSPDQYFFFLLDLLFLKKFFFFRVEEIGWRGGKKIVEDGLYESLSVSKSEYHEFGASRISKKFIL